MPILELDGRELRQFGKALRGADKEIRTELFKAVSRATKPVKEEVQAEARRSLPSRGGLGEWVARVGVRTRQAYTGRSVGVTITGKLGSKPRPKGRRRKTFGKADLVAINRGRVMHPAWGRGPLVGPQMVRAGFWDRPMETLLARRAAHEIRAAIRAAAEKIQQAAGRAA